jgi:hypothetical protein
MHSTQTQRKIAIRDTEKEKNCERLTVEEAGGKKSKDIMSVREQRDDKRVDRHIDRLPDHCLVP